MDQTHIKDMNYATACRETGLTKESLLEDFAEVIFEVLSSDGFGYGDGYTPDDTDLSEAWVFVHSIADRVRNHDLIPDAADNEVIG